MITCLKCRQDYSEQDHECLEEMTLEEIYAHSEREVAKLLADAIERNGEEVVRRAFERPAHLNSFQAKKPLEFLTVEVTIGGLPPVE